MLEDFDNALGKESSWCALPDGHLAEAQGARRVINWNYLTFAVVKYYGGHKAKEDMLILEGPWPHGPFLHNSHRGR